jgi:hypothetical protein
MGAAASDNTSVPANAQAGHGELTGVTSLIEPDPLTLTPHMDTTVDRGITEDPMLVELGAALTSSRVATWPPPVTQLKDEAPAVVTCVCT